MLEETKVQRIVFRMGKRIYLRPILKEDIAHFTVWINDPEVTQFILASHPMTPEDEQEWFNGMAKKKDTDITFAIVLEESDELIGNMSIHKINRIDGTAITGSVIGRKDCWGKGYGTEAKMLLLDYAFNTLNLRKINSSVIDYNVRSKKCMEKCGYKEEGRKLAQIFRNGAYRDEILTAVFKDDFLPLWQTYKKKYLEEE